MLMRVDHATPTQDTGSAHKRQTREGTPVASYTLRNQSCGTGLNCPRIEREDDALVLTGDWVDDPTLPAHEAKVRLPRTMFPELFDLEVDLGGFVKQATADLLHVETLDRYDVSSDGGDYERFLRGEPGPTSPDIAPFHEWIRRDVAGGVAWRRVHILRTPLTPYLAYELGWLYPGNADAGEDIRILDVAEHSAAGQLLPLGDFWAVDRTHVARSRYDAAGRFLGASAASADSASAFVALGELAWALGTAFTQWWGAQSHRRVA
jgi:hypothetical protein